MTDRQASLVACWFAVSAPLLAFPQLMGPWFRWVALLATISVALAVYLSAGAGIRSWLVGAFGVSVIIGWARAADSLSALSHFSGIGLGLMSMVALAAWARSAHRVLLAVTGFVFLGTGVLIAGLSGAKVQAPKYLPASVTDLLPQLSLGLPDLGVHKAVNPNALAATALLVSPVALAMLLSGYQGRLASVTRVFSWIILTTSLAILILMQSRAAWLACGMLLIVAGVYWYRRRFVLGLAAAAIMAAALYVAIGPDARSVSAATAAVQRTVDSRIPFWTGGLELLARSPWFGVGLNEFRNIFSHPVPHARVSPWAHAHNVFLQTALDLGLVGLAVYLWMIGSILASAVRFPPGIDPRTRRIALGAAFSVIAVHFFGLADSVSLGARVGLFQWLSLGLIVAASRIRDSAVVSS